jgi:aminopeptidase N
VPLRHYVFPEYRYGFEQLNPVIGEMIDWMGGMFGPYPFEAFGYVTISGLGASLETQTMVVLSEHNMMSETLLSHEMAHMWFGDWVSLDSWGDMWRSEGFATYVQLLWDTRAYPEALAEQLAHLEEMVAEPASDYPLNDPPPWELFGRDSYFKGALLVHALRQEMGDEAFFGGLRAYFSQYGGGTATHAQFQAVMEGAAGLSLDEFFEQWFQ